MRRPDDSLQCVLRATRTVAVLLTALSLRASAQGVSGTWTAAFDRDITMTRDSAIVKARGRATLTLVQRGDSVRGTWKTDTIDPVEVTGTFVGRTLRLTTGVHEREIRVDGAPRRVKTRTDFAGSLDGNRLTGTMLVYFGDREPPPRRWEAERAGG